MSQIWTRLANAGRTLRRGLLQVLYPISCHCCGELLDESTNPTPPFCCDSCYHRLTFDPGNQCQRCASRIGPHSNSINRCLSCQKERYHFHRTVRLGTYDNLLRDVILRMKHGTGEPLAEWIGQLWIQERKQQLQELDADVIIPIPLHWRRRLRRGYNQSEALAESLAQSLRLPCLPSLLKRIRATLPQTSQSSEARRTNVQGAFRARSHSRLERSTVLLVDDVMTTGSTLSEAAKELRKAGASHVIATVLARAGERN